MSIKPITPDEVGVAQSCHFPDEVFEAVNELIAENFYEDGATILTKDIVERMKDKGLNEGKIHEKGWLNFEPAYREAGWTVSFDRPAYDKRYDSMFIFTRSK